jgi:hypothetical protein
MVKKLRFSKIDLVERVGALMLVTFLDDDGNMYQWAPKWKEVEQVFLKQINVERFNKPESQWLNKFAKTAQQVVEGAQKIESAYKLFGEFKRYAKQSLVIEGETQPEEVNVDYRFIKDSETGKTKYEYLLKPGFDVTLEFLDNWLGNYVEAFMINDIAIRFRQYGQWDSIEKEYPPVEPKEPQEPEDLPF